MTIYQIRSDSRILALFVKKSNARKWLVDKKKEVRSRVSFIEDLPDSIAFDSGGWSGVTVRFKIVEVNTEDEPDFIVNVD